MDSQCFPHICWRVVNVANMIPPHLFFFSPIHFLAILFVCVFVFSFHISFRISLSMSTTQPAARIFIGITVSPEINFRRMHIFTMLNILTCDHGMFLHLFVCLVFFFFPPSIFLLLAYKYPASFVRVTSKNWFSFLEWWISFSNTLLLVCINMVAFVF